MEEQKRKEEEPKREMEEQKREEERWGAQVCVQVCLVTQCVMQVLLPNQLQVLFDGFGGQRVLPEDQHVVVGAAVHL